MANSERNIISVRAYWSVTYGKGLKTFKNRRMLASNDDYVTIYFWQFMHQYVSLDRAMNKNI